MRELLAVSLLGVLGLANKAWPDQLQTLTVMERAVSDKTVETGGRADALGNLLVFANPVYDARVPWAYR